MITEKGKAFIARNFGVNNCYTLEDVVSCTVYSKGAPSARVLDTPTIVFLLVTDIVDWVKTSTGRFTLADLVAANEGNYISMSEALDITAYCIPGAAPPTAPIVPLTTPAAKITKAGIITELTSKGAIDTAAVSTTPSANKWYIYYNRLNYHTANFEKGIEIRNLGTRNPPTQVSDISLTKNKTSVSELDSSWVLARLAELPYAAAAAGAQRQVKVTATSAIPLWYTDDTDVYAVPVTKGSQFDQGIAICDGRYERNECWERYPEKCVIYSSQITSYEGVVEKTININGYRGRVRIDFTKRPYEMHVTITSYPAVTAPVTALVTPPVTPPPTGAKDYEIINPTVNCDSSKCYARFDLKNNSSSASAYIRVDIDGAPCYKRYVYILRGSTKPQVVSTSITGLSSGYHDLTIVVGRITDADTYTHRFFVGGPGIEPPAAAVKITNADIAAELGRRGPIDTAALSTTVGKDKWYLVRGEYGGKWVSYVATNFIKSISLDIDVRNPPTQAADITLKANHNVVNELDSSWVLARLAELPYAAAAGAQRQVKVTATSAIPLWYTDDTDVYAVPVTKGSQFDQGIAICDGRYERNDCWERYPEKCVIYSSQITRYEGVKEETINVNGYRGRVRIDFTKRPYEMHVTITSAPVTPPVTPITPKSLSAAEFVAEIRRRGTLDLARISMIPGDNKWFRFAGQVVYRVAGGQSAIALINPGKSNMVAAFSKAGRTVTRVETNWAMARIAELPFTAPPVTPPAAPPAAPPVTAGEPSEAIKAWIVANYGDGTRVTGDGGRKLNVAKMANMLAALPSGYSKADITEGVVLWAMDNPNWESATICAWIEETGVTRLTEDHGLYIYNSAVGWTTLANRIYDTLSPKPSKPSAGIVTEDNGLGVYDYAIGWKTIANRITRCNF
jgi:hypothetical protein